MSFIFIPTIFTPLASTKMNPINILNAHVLMFRANIRKLCVAIYIFCRQQLVSTFIECLSNLFISCSPHIFFTSLFYNYFVLCIVNNISCFHTKFRLFLHLHHCVMRADLFDLRDFHPRQ